MVKFRYYLKHIPDFGVGVNPVLQCRLHWLTIKRKDSTRNLSLLCKTTSDWLCRSAGRAATVDNAVMPHVSLPMASNSSNRLRRSGVNGQV